VLATRTEDASSKPGRSRLVTSTGANYCTLGGA